MLVQSRAFRLAKDADRPEENEDAYRLDESTGTAVIADGVASAIFSRHWADLLVEATARDLPDPNDPEAFAGWLGGQRETWARGIDISGLAWFQKAKLPGGAFSTLLWVRLLPIDQQRPGTFGGLRLHAFAIGDSCLFHLRGGELVRTFPIAGSEQLREDPIVLGSVDLGRDHLIEFAELDEVCYPGDMLVLCTDAVADWALRTIESGDTPHWDDHWEMTQKQWRDEILHLRASDRMRCDDATQLLIRVAPDGPTVRPPAAQESIHGWRKWRDQIVRKWAGNG